MRKNHQQQPPAPFLPLIAQPNTHKPQPSSTCRLAKENIHASHNTSHQFKPEAAHHCLVKRNSLKNVPCPFDVILNKKLPPEEQIDIPTQPKNNKPWVPHQGDLNNLATRTNRLKPLSPKKDPSARLRRNSCHNRCPTSEYETSFEEILVDKTAKIPRSIAGRNGSLPREKIFSCKIAMKKGVFPMS